MDVNEVASRLELPVSLLEACIILLEIDDIARLATLKGHRSEEMAIFGNEEGMQALLAELSKHFHMTEQIDAPPEDWTVAGVRFALDKRILTKNLSFYVNDTLYAIIDVANEKVHRMMDNPGVITARTSERLL